MKKLMNKFNAPNHIFNNWNKDLYIASKNGVGYDEYLNQTIIYDEPFYFGKVNYQPLTTKQMEAYMKAYGETENQIISCLINYTDKNKIKKFDLAYLYGANPKSEVKYGDNANYLVKAVKPQNTKIMILFEEIIKEENNGED